MPSSASAMAVAAWLLAGRAGQDHRATAWMSVGPPQ